MSHTRAARRTSGERVFPIDERLVMPETRYEIVDGQVVYVTPADPPHASRHSKLSALLEAHVADGYDAASDMLTRTSEKGDMAPDASVYRMASDPATGGRWLEELAFEVVSKQTLRSTSTKAERLATRGVRRVFAVDVERQRALEWSQASRTWKLLPDSCSIEDAAFVVGLPVAALVRAAKVDDAVARALLAKHNPVLERALRKREASSLLVVLRSRRLAPTRAQARRILATHDAAMLGRWLRRAATCRSVSELLRPRPHGKKRR